MNYLYISREMWGDPFKYNNQSLLYYYYMNELENKHKLLRPEDDLQSSWMNVKWINNHCMFFINVIHLSYLMFRSLVMYSIYLYRKHKKKQTKHIYKER